MAKKNDANVATVETPTTGIFDTGNISVPSQTLEFDGHTVSTGNLPVASLAYLLQYGFAQCLQDMSLAQIRAGAERKGIEMTAGEVAEALTARRAAKVENLLTGQIFVRKAGVPKGTTFDKMVHAVAKEMVTAAVIKKGIAMPKGEALVNLITAYIGKYGDSVRAEAQRRIDMAPQAAEIDIDDLF